ncbi:hypothetical protein J1N35_008227 [Gossypium stocksii]|uniref:Uncharacterized protein n=1 Tax=Gossypium stocksii TaxID=47602 RepID=A0A9D3W7B6_9ROSI|nr:hypothetical protein J1N35_008227 [Gossypium stocksii]
MTISIANNSFSFSFVTSVDENLGGEDRGTWGLMLVIDVVGIDISVNIKASSARAPRVGQDRGKGLLGTLPLSFPPKNSLVMSPTDEDHLGTPSRAFIVDSVRQMLQLQCPQFDGTNFRS